jgi:hypothetical protein
MTALLADSTVARDEIHVAENVQALDVEHVRAPAGSIRLLECSCRSSDRSRLTLRSAGGSTSSLRVSVGWWRRKNCG